MTKTMMTIMADARDSRQVWF